MASSANHQEAGDSGYNLTIQRQQQELIKLLTQHFHRQFYQLAANNCNPAVSINGSISNVQQVVASNHNPQTTQTSAANFRQQQPEDSTRIQQHFQSNPSLLTSGFNLSNSMNVVDTINNSNNQYQQRLHNELHSQILRSQQAPTSNSGNTGAPANLNLTEVDLPGNSLLDYTLRNSLNPYLYNALGLTNEQLILSTFQQQQQRQQQQQQQPPLQASALNSRLRSLRADLLDEREVEEHAHKLERRNSNDINTMESEEDNNHNNHLHQQQHKSDAKGMLKFSINTILGKGSPHHHLNNNCNNLNLLDHPPRKHLASNALDCKSAKPQLKNEQLNALGEMIGRDDEGEQRLFDHDNDLLDCDQSESCSDSSSVDTSTPQETRTSSSSILFGSQLIPSNHLSATNPTAQHHNTIAASTLIVSSSQQQPSVVATARANQARQFTLPYMNGSAAFPWTVATRGKPRRGMMRRAVFSDSQRVGLEKRFQLQKYISKPDRKKLAEKLGLRDSQVKIWFQNRRMKWRNSKERELLSAGGSREQTLPTRNNPNPDLSDVGETIKRLTTNSVTNNNNITAKPVD